MEIHDSARRHGILEADIVHGFENAVLWVELGDDPPRFLVVGPDSAGNLLELIVLDLEGVVLVIHAMKLRKSTAAEMFGEEER